MRKRSEIAFDGFTWPERFIVLTTPSRFRGASGAIHTAAISPSLAHGAIASRFRPTGRPACGDGVPDRTVEDDAAIMSDHGVQDRIQRFFPEPRPYDIVHRNLYVTHQRVAATFRKGRVLLAGDAAHVNNPIGGMGLNGGIQDAVNLAGKLAGILLGGESDRSLDLYNLQRRTVATEFVQEQSIANKKRLEESDPRTRQKNSR